MESHWTSTPLTPPRGVLLNEVHTLTQSPCTALTTEPLPSHQMPKSERETFDGKGEQDEAKRDVQEKELVSHPIKNLRAEERPRWKGIPIALLANTMTLGHSFSLEKCDRLANAYGLDRNGWICCLPRAQVEQTSPGAWHCRRIRHRSSLGTAILSQIQEKQVSHFVGRMDGFDEELVTAKANKGATE